MSNKVEVFSQILGLLDTLYEGLTHAGSLFAEDKSDEAIEMLYNVLAGMESILNAITPYVDQLDSSKLRELEADMLENFNKLINLLSSQNIDMIRDSLNNTLTPAFINWQSEVKRLLIPFTLS